MSGGGVLDMFSLTEKVAVVTGGAGLFGRQIAEALAEAGARTFVASRDLAKLEHYAADLRGRGLAVEALPLDQAEETSIEALASEVVARAGGVDVLVNNAVLRPMKSWDDPAEQFEQSMRVNATGVFLMLRTFGGRMAERGRGSIINIGSIQGVIAPDYTLYEEVGWDVPPDYFFHKGGMIQLTRFAAARLGPRGVRANCIIPGGFYNRQDERFVKRYCDRTFLGRMANDTDLKGAVVFLASDASAYVTGANLTVDGGYTAK
jgi:NAD(P)-dependent dehydrogenase (short-subunit alcohol dehydrogenase family)